jgi:hypothetical protein
MFHHRNIHKYYWTSPDGKTHNQTDHIERQEKAFGRLNVQSFRGADCDTEHYLVVAKGRERLPVCIQVARKFDVERFNVRKLNELEVGKQYQIKTSHRFATL